MVLGFLNLCMMAWSPSGFMGRCNLYSSSKNHPVLLQGGSACTAILFGKCMYVCFEKMQFSKHTYVHFPNKIAVQTEPPCSLLLIFVLHCLHIMEKMTLLFLV